MAAPWNSSVFLERLGAQTGRRRILCADADDTLHVNDVFPWAEECRRALWLLSTKLDAHCIPLAVVTGRHYTGNRTSNDKRTFVGARQLVERQWLSPADILVTSVGNEIWVRQKHPHQLRYRRDLRFAEMVRQTSFDHERFLGEATDLFRALARDFVGCDLTLQRGTTVGNHLGFHFMSSPELCHELYRQVAVYMQHIYPALKISICEEGGHNRSLPPGTLWRKYCLDITPRNKADAVQYLAEIFGLEWVVTAGDSGNDTCMVVDLPQTASACHYDSIVVGGHKPELRHVVDQATVDCGMVRTFLNAPQRRCIIDTTGRAAQSVLAGLETLEFFLG